MLAHLKNVQGSPSLWKRVCRSDMLCFTLSWSLHQLRTLRTPFFYLSFTGVLILLNKPWCLTRMSGDLDLLQHMTHAFFCTRNMVAFLSRGTAAFYTVSRSLWIVTQAQVMILSILVNIVIAPRNGQINLRFFGFQWKCSFAGSLSCGLLKQRCFLHCHCHIVKHPNDFLGNWVVLDLEMVRYWAVPLLCTRE